MFPVEETRFASSVARVGHINGKLFTFFLCMGGFSKIILLS